MKRKRVKAVVNKDIVYRIILLSLMFLSSIFSMSQTLDDIGKIVIGFEVPGSSSSETQELKEYLSNKVSHWIAQAGYSASGISSFNVDFVSEKKYKSSNIDLSFVKDP